MEIEALLVTADAEWEHIIGEGGRCENAMAAVYITEVPKLAERLVAEKVPCIYIEEPGTPQRYVRGVDYIFQGKLDYEAGQKGCYGMDREFLLRVWQRYYHLPWTIAETERLVIRESVMDDLAALTEIYGCEEGNPDVVPFLGEPEGELQAYIDSRYPFYGYGLWSIVEKTSGRVIGRAGLEDWLEGIELSYLIGSAYRRQGYALEAAKAILEYAKNGLEAEEIYLRTSGNNTASSALAHRLGFEAYKGEVNKRILRLYL